MEQAAKYNAKPMAPYGTERYWLEKAEQARVFRATIRDNQSRELVFQIVTSYEMLAKASRR